MCILLSVVVTQHVGYLNCTCFNQGHVALGQSDLVKVTAYCYSEYMTTVLQTTVYIL